MNIIFEQIKKIGLIPVISIENVKDVEPLGRALIDGGLPIAEITFRTDAAEEAIKIMTKKFPEILTGAGTVLNIKQANSAINAGAKFIVSPGTNPEVVKFCLERKVPIIPGCSNPTDIEVALGLGLNVLKFFPSEALGGLNMLKAMSAPYGMVKFIPTGGINLKNIEEYLSFNKILACGGSWMVKADLIKEGNFDEITIKAKQAIETILGFEFGHIGINMENENSALDISTKLSDIFNFPLTLGNSSNFAGNEIEITKKTGLGKNGHIAIKTNSITRAIAYFERMGLQVDMSTAKRSADDLLAAVYLKEEIAGFAMHLLQKK